MEAYSCQSTNMIQKDDNRVTMTPNNTRRVNKPPRRIPELKDYLANKRQRHQHRSSSLSTMAKNHGPFLDQFDLMKRLPIHEGCVNTICWNKTGEYLLSGSDDRHLCVTKPACLHDTSTDYKTLNKTQTLHNGNIFSAKFMPMSADSLTVSCSSNGPVIAHDLKMRDSKQGLAIYNCHSNTIYDVEPFPDEAMVFLSCSEDKTIRLFDLRCHRSCSRSSTCPHPALIKNSEPITTMSIHPLNSNLFLVGRADGKGLVYDRRKLPNVAEFSREKAHVERLSGIPTDATLSGAAYLHPLDGVVCQFSVPSVGKSKFTSLCYSPRGDQVLASYMQDYVYLFETSGGAPAELIRTLPKREASSSEASLSAPGSARQPPRAPRIRLRGDWSDTGIHSTPQSQQPHLNRLRILESLTQRALRSLRPEVGRPPFDAPRSPVSGLDESSSSSDSTINDSSSSSDLNEHPSTTMNVELMNDSRSATGAASSSEAPDTSVPNSSIQSGINQASKRPPTSSNISDETKHKFKHKFCDRLKSKYKGQIKSMEPHVQYQGHRNCRTTFKEAKFWGDDYIISGSDCGRIFFWEKRTGKIVTAFAADGHVVNCLAPNPHFYSLASSGIDKDIKLWSCQSLKSRPLMLSSSEIDMIVQNNEAMIEDARNSIVVPPQLFIHFFATLSQQGGM